MTLDNLAEHSQYTNVRNTFTELLNYGVIPVVNENVSPLCLCVCVCPWQFAGFL